jgi:hypothetical protein
VDVTTLQIGADGSAITIGKDEIERINAAAGEDSLRDYCEERGVVGDVAVLADDEGVFLCTEVYVDDFAQNALVDLRLAPETARELAALLVRAAEAAEAK